MPAGIKPSCERGPDDMGPRAQAFESSRSSEQDPEGAVEGSRNRMGARCRSSTRGVQANAIRLGESRVAGESEVTHLPSRWTSALS